MLVNHKSLVLFATSRKFVYRNASDPLVPLVPTMPSARFLSFASGKGGVNTLP